MAENVDLVILGAGPGGYVAAIRASQLGLKTVVVEKEKVGGVCLHKGCIPSKSLLRSAELFHQMKQSEDFGIRAEGVRLDMEGVQKRKNRIREQLHQGVQHLLKKNGVRVVKGTGRILGPSIFSPQPGTISVEKAEESEAEMLVPQNIIIATGSRPRSLPGLTIDGEYILHSDHVLEMEQLPESMVILGGGVIGLEWASMLNDFGVEVTVVEAMDRILPQEDPDVNKEMTRLLKKRNVEVLTEARLIPELVSVENGRVAFQVDQGGRQRSLDAEKMLVAVGRQPNTEDIGLQNTSIRLDRGFISVNSFMQTNESHIYAIGDVTGNYQLAHVASHEGMVAVDHIAGKKPHPLEPEQVPRCTYTRPEIGSLGLSEKEAKQRGYEVKVGRFPFRGAGKSLVAGEGDGFIKLIADKQTDDLLGVHIIGPHATELISEAGLAKVLDATPWEITQAIHPHPTLSEVYGEVAMGLEGLPVHA